MQKRRKITKNKNRLVQLSEYSDSSDNNNRHIMAYKLQIVSKLVDKNQIYRSVPIANINRIQTALLSYNISKLDLTVFVIVVSFQFIAACFLFLCYV